MKFQNAAKKEVITVLIFTVFAIRIIYRFVLGKMMKYLVLDS